MVDIGGRWLICGVAGGCGLWPVWVVVAVVDENGGRDNILF